MKNKLIKGLFGFGLILLMTTGVNATVGTGDSVNGGYLYSPSLADQNVNAVVGEVDATVYSVTISWTSMQFNYRYDEAKSSYSWVVNDICELVEDLNNVGKYDSLHTDQWCDAVYEGEVLPADVGAGLYGKILGGRIIIADNSILGSVTPSVKWTSNDGYEAVNGLLSYGGCDENNCGDSRTFELNSNSSMELPDNARFFDGCVSKLDGTGFCSYAYNLSFRLETDMSLGPINPTKGDTIGRLTISFEGKSTIK